MEQQDPQPHLQFQRWYDQDVQLSELVDTMRTLSEESQTLFAFLLTFFCDEIVRTRGQAFFQTLEWEKLMGIYKSKKGRRWYDQQPVLQKAFNKLYSLEEADQALIAKQLYTPARIIRHYETHCARKSTPLEVDVLAEIVETCFTQGPQAAETHYRNFQ